MTRCIGDRPLRHLGLTAEPEVTVTPLGTGDKALVLASDGLWDVMPHSRVLHCLEHVEDLLITVLFVASHDNFADFFTKYLAPKHSSRALRDIIMNVPRSQRSG